MVAVLVKIFGTEHLQLAEDVLQDALISALESWKIKGLPKNPRAWLYRAARNKAIDVIRKNKFSETFDFSDPERQLLTSEYTLTATMNSFWEDDSIQDDFLGMMYACCHSDISAESQITFILKSLCGFSTKEIAKAFVTTEDTISKRLYRTKEFFRKSQIRPTIPNADEILDKTNAVLGAIYLLFNEGYNSTHSDELVRYDLIAQAITLCRSLTETKRTQLPEVYAMLALMYFHAARIESRMNSSGDMILLSEQDRKLWDKKLIQLGNRNLNKSAFGDRISSYHAEAAIAFLHCNATTYEATDWGAILKQYDTLFSITQDPIVWLNRCLVILELEGPEHALKKIKEWEVAKLKKYYLYPAALGEIYQRMNLHLKAIHYYKEAIQLTHSRIERNFLLKKIEDLNSKG